MTTIPAIDMVATGRNMSFFLDIIFEIVMVEEKLLIIAEEAAQ